MKEKNKMEFEEISKEDFEEYEKVRVGGKTNMFDVNMVCRLSKHKLYPDLVMGVMKKYGKLMEKFPGVRNGK